MFNAKGDFFFAVSKKLFYVKRYFTCRDLYHIFNK